MVRGKAKRTGPGRKGPPKREFTHDPKGVLTSMLDNQRAALNSNESFVDVILILQDGIIPVHGVLLEAVSEFLRKCFESQGPYYYGPREVLLPDHNMNTMQKVIQLLYNPIALVQTEAEAKEVEEAISSLGIKLEAGLSTTKVINASCSQEVQTIAMTSFKSRDYLGKPMIKTEGRTAMTSDGKKVELKELSVNVSRLTSASSSSSSSAPLKPTMAAVSPAAPPETEAVPAALPQLNSRAVAHVSSSEEESSSASEPRVLIPRPNYKPQMIADPDSSGEESLSASEMDEEAMSKPEWYMSKAKTCQKCKTDYKTPGEASLCLSSHDRQRCWLCFRVCKTTDLLFEHYARAHRQGSRHQSVICPCCELSISFRDVSSHVANNHLSQDTESQAKPYRRYRSTYKPPTQPAPTKTDDINPAKRLRVEEELKVDDLDLSISVTRPTGRVWMFHVKKKRV